MSYKKECMYCKQEILMSETLGKWFPLNLEDNSPHMCREKEKKAAASKPSKPLTLEDLDLRLRMVESLVLKGGGKK